MLYVVSVTVDADVHQDWLRWMRDVHVPDVVATGCFQSATMARNTDGDTTDRFAYRILYHAHSPEMLDKYQREFAPDLKREHSERYQGSVSASREILPVIATLYGDRG